MLESLRIPVVIFLFCHLHLTALNNITNFQSNICSLDLVPELHTIQSLTDNSARTASQTSHAQTWTPIHPPLLPQTCSICTPLLISRWPFPPLCAQSPTFPTAVSTGAATKSRRINGALFLLHSFYHRAFHWQFLCGNQLVRESRKIVCELPDTRHWGMFRRLSVEPSICGRFLPQPPS